MNHKSEEEIPLLIQRVPKPRARTYHPKYLYSQSSFPVYLCFAFLVSSSKLTRMRIQFKKTRIHNDLVLIGSVFLIREIAFISNLKRANNYETWPSVNCTITNTRIEYYKSTKTFFNLAYEIGEEHIVSYQKWQYGVISEVIECYFICRSCVILIACLEQTGEILLCIYNPKEYSEAHFAEKIVGLVSDYKTSLWVYPLIGLGLIVLFVLALVPLFYFQRADFDEFEFQISSSSKVDIPSVLSDAPVELATVVHNIIHTLNSKEVILSWKQVCASRYGLPGAYYCVRVIYISMCLFVACGYQFLMFYSNPDNGSPLEIGSIFMLILPSMIPMPALLVLIYLLSLGNGTIYKPATYMVITSERGIVLKANMARYIGGPKFIISCFGWNDGYFCAETQYFIRKTGIIGVKMSYGLYYIGMASDYGVVNEVKSWLLSYVPNCDTY